MTRHAVLLTYGEPPGPDFAAHLRYSWRILLALTRSIARIPAAAIPVIALARARQRHDLWTRERYRSPLEAITRAQGAALARRLAGEGGDDWRVHAAWEFRDPSLTAVLDAIPGDEPAEVLPLYVADSGFTHALARSTVSAWRARHPERTAPVRVRPALRPSLLAGLWAAHVRARLAGRGVKPGPEWALVLAAHGAPLAPPPGVETGREAIEQLFQQVSERLARDFGLVTSGWLNHARGGRWTEPPIAEALAHVARAGFRRVVYLPCGFLADNAETELEGRLALRAEPSLEAVHLPCLNDDPVLIEMLAGQLALDDEARAPAVRAG